MTVFTLNGQKVQPGDIAAVRMGGDAGRLIRIGQWLNGDGFRDFEHAISYIGGPDDLILEAEPGGARLVPMHYVAADCLWSTGAKSLELTDAQRAMAPEIAEKYKGVPYSALDYQALAMHRLHIPSLPLWPGDKGLCTLKTFIGETGHMICSQMADQFRQDMGSHLFTDPPVWPGYVTPGAISGLIARSL